MLGLSPVASLRRQVFRSHRLLGACAGGLFVMWFLSGIVLIYSGGMPYIRTAERQRLAAPLDPATVTITPQQAAAAAGKPSPGSVSLSVLLGRPVYRIDDQLVYADDGQRRGPLSEPEARALAAEHVGLAPAQLRLRAEQHTVDQWTLSKRGALPLYRYRGGGGEEVYVSASRARVEQHTTRRARLLAWAGAIPHWLYLRGLRIHRTAWTVLVIALSALGVATALLGLGAGGYLLRRGKKIPYRGDKRRHVLLGLGFGVTSLSWVSSGLVSMEPLGWTAPPPLQAPPGDALFGDGAPHRIPGPSDWSACFGERAIKRIVLQRARGVPLLSIRWALPDGTLGEGLVDASSLSWVEAPLPEAALLEVLAPLEAPVASHAVLTAYDAYYRDPSGGSPLPVLRARFTDPARTWLYLDARTGALVYRTTRRSRQRRWLFDGLHTLDLLGLPSRRPLWDVLMLALLLGGLATSSAGLWSALRSRQRRLAQRKRD